MNLSEVRSIVQQNAAGLREFDVKSLSVFGSVARGEERTDSDVDMLVEFRRPVGLFTLVRLQQFLESILEHRVDLGTAESLRPRVRTSVLAEAVRVA